MSEKTRWEGFPAWRKALLAPIRGALWIFEHNIGALLAVATLLAVVGLAVFYVYQSVQVEEQQCHASPVALGQPQSVPAVMHALDDLYQQRVISSPEDAFDTLSGTAWVLDPRDGYRLEYWMTFSAGSSSTTVGFEIICIGPDLAMVWKYDGVQDVQ